MALFINRELNDDIIPVNIVNVSSASSTFAPIIANGKVIAAWGVLQSSIGVADAVITIRSGNSSNMTNGTLTLATSGSSARVPASCIISGNNGVVEGDFIELASSGASSGTVAANVFLVLRR